MTDYNVLSKEMHLNLRVITAHGKQYGDNVMHAMTFPHEFRDVQSTYPIFFCKDQETGGFYPAALFGLEQNENLFLTDLGWDATYVPMSMRRHPFLIGFQVDDQHPDGKNPVVSVDMDNPRVNTSNGESLFLADGTPSDYLTDIMGLLESIHAGHEQNKGFVQTLVDHDLLEAFTLEVTLKDGSKNQLTGFYTIKEPKLYQLDGSTLESLNKQGYLQAIFMAMASHARLRPLVEKKSAVAR